MAAIAARGLEPRNGNGNERDTERTSFPENLDAPRRAPEKNGRLSRDVSFSEGKGWKLGRGGS